MNLKNSAAIVSILLMVFGCATARVNQFQEFSKVGIAYADAVGVLLEEAGRTAIDTDTLIITKTRKHLNRQSRIKTISEHNDLLRERISLLNDLNRHAQLLRTYFGSLAILAASDAPSGIGTATESVVASMGKISEEIKDAKVGELSVDSFVGSTVSLSVGYFKQAALEKELNKRAASIGREINLQEAALQAVSEQMQTDLEVILQQQELKEVYRPYASDSDTLPSGWAKKRKELLMIRVSIKSADAAVQAAQSLKISFIALVENRLDPANIEFIIKDINDILALVGKVKGIETETQ